MEQYYILLVGILFIFAIFDLVVGVSNDAVNFLNSAIGSKVAPFWAIMIIASLGVLGGAISSDGMMEVARKGIFVPSMFTFHDIMIIFIGVMLTDVILLNSFNSLGLPTSTTVSIVFELLGGAVSMAIINLNTLQKPLSDIFQYIKTDSAIKIIGGIFLAIIVAFIAGAVVQWIVRFIFSFNYEKNIKRYGSLFGGISVTVLTYFMLIKGAKHASFMTAEFKDYIANNIAMVWLYSIIGWTVIIQLLHSLLKMNILKFVVLAGTFSLALAFAGNDLVNFIGVPLAGLSSFNEFMSSGGINETFFMNALAKPVETPLIFLLLAGMIMVVTLWLSKKARSVTQTTLNLSDQTAGEEQFGSSVFARVIVRSAVNTSEKFGKFVPEHIKKFVSKRFEMQKEANTHTNKSDALSFDLLRAAVNLIVASMLITAGTSLKLPLSTTYVTFMVAMATSFSDGAWGRETAVYRITGVLTVIAGWFLTAFIAFAFCGFIVYIIHLGGIYALLSLFVIAIIIVIRSKIFKSKKEKEEEYLDSQKIDLTETNVITRSFSGINSVFTQTGDILSQVYDGFNAYNHHELKRAKQRSKQLDKNAKKLKDQVSSTLYDLQENNMEINFNYVQVVDYLREMARSLTFITNPAFEHVGNNHKPLLDEQKAELYDIKTHLESYFAHIVEALEHNDFDKFDALIDEQNDLFILINKIRKKHLKRVKNGAVNTRNSMLYIQLLHEAKQIISFSLNAIKSHRDLTITYNNIHIL
ncbi:MAG: inorganic phosphate transporter [Bacteroidales bacterium]|jgi:phosphate/sulfate permease|nr:inorganic phosphate transporter [Bacteroidales bacterium]